MNSVVSGLLRGAAAGAAGSTALGATTYLDVAVRGRAPSNTPGLLAAAVTDAAGVAVPGGRRERARRLDAIGALAGTATGVGLGGLAGALRGMGLRLPTVLGGPLLGLAAMAASDGPLAVLRISDPRRWTLTDWMADAVPHLVYGVTTHATLVAVSRVAERREPVPATSAGALLRAAAVGAASGSRSAMGVAALALSSDRNSPGAVASRLGSRTGTVLSGLAATAELVSDKVPGVPSRLAPAGFVPRAALGATTAAAVARRDGSDPAPAALVGVAAAAAAAVLGVRWRTAAERRFGSDRPGALIEDAAAALLAYVGTRKPTIGAVVPVETSTGGAATP